MAKPLYDLTKEGVKFDFSDECRKVFETLKEYLTSSPILAIYNPRREQSCTAMLVQQDLALYLCKSSKIVYSIQLLTSQKEQRTQKHVIKALS